jgi:hypothetical protein
VVSAVAFCTGGAALRVFRYVRWLLDQFAGALRPGDGQGQGWQAGSTNLLILMTQTVRYGPSENRAGLPAKRRWGLPIGLY